MMPCRMSRFTGRYGFGVDVAAFAFADADHGCLEASSATTSTGGTNGPDRVGEATFGTVQGRRERDGPFCGTTGQVRIQREEQEHCQCCD